MIYEVERSRPTLRPDVEFIIVRTTGISEEVLHWLIKSFGHTDEGRWFIIVRSIFFRHEKDYIWFRLKWK